MPYPKKRKASKGVSLGALIRRAQARAPRVRGNRSRLLQIGRDVRLPVIRRNIAARRIQRLFRRYNPLYAPRFQQPHHVLHNWTSKGLWPKWRR